MDGFKNWTDSKDVPEDAVDRDAMLTNVMLYWLTGTAGSGRPDVHHDAAEIWRTEPTPSPRCPRR